MSDVRCVRIKLKPGSLPRVREWSRELNDRMDEVVKTLEEEGVYRELVFLEQAEDGDYLVYLIDVEDFEKGRAVYHASTHPIDHYHRAFTKETFDARRELELLLDAAGPGERGPGGQP